MQDLINKFLGWLSDPNTIILLVILYKQFRPSLYKYAKSTPTPLDDAAIAAIDGVVMHKERGKK